MTTLRPVAAGDSETDWRDPWGAAHRAHDQLVGLVVTRQIDADPAGAERLRAARRDARAGRRHPCE